ncbi:hypothetical protein MJ564_18130 [Escherichia coli]|nr:hypothetical protein MJ564_18130 [Escherichia coli]
MIQQEKNHVLPTRHRITYRSMPQQTGSVKAGGIFTGVTIGMGIFSLKKHFRARIDKNQGPVRDGGAVSTPDLSNDRLLLADVDVPIVGVMAQIPCRKAGHYTSHR